MEGNKKKIDQIISKSDSIDDVVKPLNKPKSNNTLPIDISSDNESDDNTFDDTETNTSEVSHLTEDDFIDDEIRESVFASTVFDGPENASNPAIGTIVHKFLIEKFANLRKANPHIKELDKEGKLNVIDIFGSPGIKLTQSKQYKGYGTQPFRRYEDFDPTFRKIVTTRNKVGYFRYLDQKTGYRPIRNRKASNSSNIKNKKNEFIEVMTIKNILN